MKKTTRIYFVPDFLFVFVLAAFVLLLVLGAVLQSIWLLLCAVPLAAYELFRIFSRNYPARARENQVFCNAFFAPYRTLRRLWRKIFPDRRHVKMHCPSCEAPLRLAKRAGDFTVTCPRCGTRFPIHMR
jgi:hypothetical protein